MSLDLRDNITPAGRSSHRSDVEDGAPNRSRRGTEQIQTVNRVNLVSSGCRYVQAINIVEPDQKGADISKGRTLGAVRSTQSFLACY